MSTIPAGDLPKVAPGTFDSVVGVDEATGNVRRFPVDALPLPVAAETRLAAVEAGQSAGHVGFATKAAMDASLAYPEGTLALVTNDGTSANNGTYRKVGASGGGSWAQSADRVTLLEQGTAGYRGAGDPVRASLLDGMAWSVQDGEGKVAFGVRDDGAAVVGNLKVNALTVGTAVVDALQTAGATSEIADALPEYAWAVVDDAGHVALGVRKDGTVKAAGLDAGTGDAVDLSRNGGIYSHQLNYICNAGQSLAQGSDGAITSAQEYDNVGFAFAASAPASLLALTTALTGYSGQESPMYGTCGHIKKLILEENGVGYTVNDYQLAACNNGSSGAPINEIKKGGVRGRFEACMSQVQSVKNIATSEMRSCAFQAVTWTQGESDEAMAMATYRDTLIQLAADYNADGKAITGQYSDVQFISYQGCRYAGRDTVTRAQLEASEKVPYIHLATPIYFMPFYDGTHLTAAGSKWLGGYYGLVYKRVVIDKQEWQPLKPVHHAVIGNAIDLQFSKEGLVFDTTLMPAQANMGFTVFDAGGASVAIANVSIVGPNRVRIVCATAPQPGWRVKYGHIQTVGKANWTGCGGNLRDSQGDRITYAGNPMHNWCIVFNYEV